MRALLSVYDKAGVAELARGLADLGWDLVSSGGTARHLAEQGLAVTDLAELTGFPPMLGHRVVTLHPLIHGAILADPTDPEHQADLATYSIEPFALVVANLYPFGSDPSAFAHGSGASAEDLIDIGGPAMTRAAAKNHAHVGIVVDPADYGVVLGELQAGGALSDATRRGLARKAFAHTAAYDAAVVTWFDESSGDTDARGGDAAAALPPTLHLALERVDVLRYGENPHQAGARYRTRRPGWWDSVELHQGMAMSYLNWFDADAAWLLAHDLTDQPGVAIIKHANPCGVGVAGTLAEAYRLAYEGDEQSAFGGIVAFNRPVDLATAERMANAAQADVVIAPGYEDGVLDVLRAKRKNTRVLSASPPTRDPLEVRHLSGGWLVQQAPRFDTTRADWRVVTKRSPTEAEWADAELAWRICAYVKSNCVALVKDGQAVGVGAGQQSRVGAAEIAAAKAAGRAKGGASATDGFYPFPDGIEAAAQAGVAVVLQPGGSVKDDENTARADELGLAMVLTGERHFLH
ncbi:MAG: bifunctional phosphoribosylaminoimidazolecarboxamide formyltransferase/IMP cyclohydrolase [Acidimicrobiia bacterium]